MTLEQLVVFLISTETLSFSETARRLNQSQPSISQQIKALEQHLNVSLFERTRNKLKLTLAGQVLMTHALKIKQETEIAKVKINELQGMLTGELCIGASTTNGNYILSSLLITFKEKYPLVKIRLIIENGANLQTGLASGKYDLVFMEGPKPLIKKNYIITLFRRDQLVVVKNPALKLKKNVSIKTLIEQPWIIREEGSGTRELFLRNLSQNNISFNMLNILMEVGTIEAVKQALYNTPALGYLSLIAVERDIDMGLLEVVKNTKLNMQRQLWIISPEQKHQSLVMKTLLKHLIQ